MVPQSQDLTRLRSSLFASRQPRQVRLVPTPVPAGLPAPVPGRQGDIYIANPGESDPQVDSTVRAVDLKTGQKRWTAALKDGLVVAPVPSKDGQTVWASGEAVVSAFSASTGDCQGTWAPGTGDCLRPVPLEGNRAVLGNWNGNRLVALGPGCPQPLWEAEVGPTYGVPAVGAGQVFASVYNGGQIDAGGVIQALNAHTGQSIWRYESKYPIRESPAVGPDGAVYVPPDRRGKSRFARPRSASAA